MLTFISDGNSKCRLIRLCTVSIGQSKRNGHFPNSILYKITPSEYISHLELYQLPRIISGAWYRRVPTIADIYSFGYCRIWHNPKSAIFIVPSFINIFWGFMSRWTMLKLNNFLYPNTICRKYSIAWLSGKNLFLFIIWSKLP